MSKTCQCKAPHCCRDGFLDGNGDFTGCMACAALPPGDPCLLARFPGTRTEGERPMSTETTTYVTYYFPGAFFSEDSSKPVAHRDPRQAAVDAPEGAFAFTFHDQVTGTATVDGQEIPLASRALSKSGRFYIDAEKLTYADVEALDGDHHILLANMRGNRWEIVLRCRTGNYQPLEDGDQVFTSDGVLVGA